MPFHSQDEVGSLRRFATFRGKAMMQLTVSVKKSRLIGLKVNRSSQVNLRIVVMAVAQRSEQGRSAVALNGCSLSQSQACCGGV